jgi:hypothetical protein
MIAILLLCLMQSAGCAFTGKEFPVQEGVDIVWLKAGEKPPTPKVESALVSKRYWKFQTEACK